MKYLLLVALSLSFLPLFSQQVDLNKDFADWKPRNIGPSSMSGRIVGIDGVNSNPNIIYICSASGGVWKTTNGGITWEPVFDQQATLNMGSIAIQQSNPDVVWAGTGEGNPRNSLNLGEGIYKSLDAGKTWKKMGLEKTRNIYRIVIDPSDPNTVYAGAIGNPYAPHPERGVYKTTDGGESWSKILYSNDTSGCADLVMDPSNPNKLIAALWQHYRRPWTFTSGGPGSGLYITLDKGKTWTKLGKENGLPEGQLGRIGIAFAPNMPGRVYAKVEATRNGFYRSDDGGFHWQLVNDDPAQITDRPFYYQQIYVDPKNENRIYDVHSTITFSEDGGKSFSTMIPYSGIHPDHHAWWINPNDPNFIIEGNDGGIGISRDRGAHWTFDEKIPVGQFYHINVDNDIPYHVMGGMQDNGSWRGPAYTWTNSGIRNYYWENVGGGDGFDVMPDPQDPDWVYSMSQQGYVGRLHISTGERWYIRPTAPDTQTKLRFNWNSAIAQDPFDPNTIYFGSQFLHVSHNKGASWDVVSPDLTTNNPEQQDQDNTGGLTLDITGAENYNTILTIAPSTLQKGLIWVGTDDGNVQLTTDGGKSWTNFRGRIPGMPIGSWIPQIRASRYHAGEAFVVCNDYRRGDFDAYIFRTTDFGKTWTRMLDSSKVKGYALCVLQDPVEPNLIFVGSEHGLWISMDNGTSYQQWKNGYPSVSTYDLAMQEREADLAIATFGRSLWILDNIRPLRKLAANKGNVERRLSLFGAPDAWLAYRKQAPGYEWSVKGLWEGENRPYGMPISFYLKQSDQASVEINTGKVAESKKSSRKKIKEEAKEVKTNPEKENKSEKDSVWIRIYDEKGQLIRTLQQVGKPGLNTQYWALNERGHRYPGSPRPKANAPEPGGETVLPGRYKVVVSLNNEVDSAWVEVKNDPRTAFDIEARKAQLAMLDRLQTASDKLTDVLDQLRDAEEICTKVSAQCKDLEGKSIDSLRKATKSMQDSIAGIRDFISGKKDTRQGIVRGTDYTPLSRIAEARNYITSKPLAPGKQEEVLLQRAINAANEAVNKNNAFFSGPWMQYRKLAESTPISIFKDFKPVQ